MNTNESVIDFNWNSDWEDRYRALSYENVVVSTDVLARRDPTIGATVQRIGKGYAAFYGPRGAMTAASGIGVGETGYEDELAAVEDFYRNRGCSSKVWTNSATHPDFLHLLESRGYRTIHTAGTWIRPTAQPVSIHGLEHIEVRLVAQDQAEEWLNAAAIGFLEETGPWKDSLPKSAADMFYSMAFASGFTAMVAYDDKIPAGGAVIAQGHGLAILRTASTRFNHRGKGIQKALIAARLNHAQKSGSQVCLSATSASPHDTSAKNMSLFGFRLLRTSALLERAI